MFDAIVLEKFQSGQHVARKDITLPALQDGDVAINVARSTLNYKDALAITGRG